MLKSSNQINKIILFNHVIRQEKFKIIKMPKRNILSELEINALLNGVIKLIKNNLDSSTDEKKKVYDYHNLYKMYLEKQRECIRLKNEMIFLKKTLLLIQRKK